jgi:hypothetical protein
LRREKEKKKEKSSKHAKTPEEEKGYLSSFLFFLFKQLF